jgi:hypothetical protein
MREDAHEEFWWESLREKDNLVDSGVGGRIILKWLFRKEDWSEWTGLILLRIGRDKWRAVVNKVMNIRVP